MWVNHFAIPLCLSFSWGWEQVHHWSWDWYKLSRALQALWHVSLALPQSVSLRDKSEYEHAPVQLWARCPKHKVLCSTLKPKCSQHPSSLSYNKISDMCRGRTWQTQISFLPRDPPPAFFTSVNVWAQPTPKIRGGGCMKERSQHTLGQRSFPK